MKISIEEQKREAVAIALSFVRTEPQLKSVYLFKDDSGENIRIIDVVKDYFVSESIEQVDVFSFSHSIGDEYVKLLVGTIPPSYENKDILPEGWGGWENSEIVYSA